ncbi:MAG TPA: hypothetical protein VGC10_08860 [Sphingomonas sp.]
MKRLPLAFLSLAFVVVGGCANDSDIAAIGGSIGKEIRRTSCPALGVPAETGDVTLFNPPGSRDSRAIDVVATITNVRGNCDDSDQKNPTPKLATTATFRVDARRDSAVGARDVVLPYFVVIMRGGTQVISKSVGQIQIHFDDGKLTASANGQTGSSVNRADATLPQPVLNKIGRKRNSKDVDASIDPMTDPVVRSALNKASFEMLLGFQLTNEQLAYNATR